MAAQNPCNDSLVWRDAAPDTAPEPAASIMRIVPRTAYVVGRVSEEEWHLLFDAVRGRLKAAVDQPETLAGVVRECVDALERLNALQVAR